MIKYIKIYAVILVIALFVHMTFDLFQNPDKYITTKGINDTQIENTYEIEK